MFLSFMRIGKRKCFGILFHLEQGGILVFGSASEEGDELSHVILGCFSLLDSEIGRDGGGVYFKLRSEQRQKPVH